MQFVVREMNWICYNFQLNDVSAQFVVVVLLTSHPLLITWPFVRPPNRPPSPLNQQEDDGSVGGR